MIPPSLRPDSEMEATPGRCREHRRACEHRLLWNADPTLIWLPAGVGAGWGVSEAREAFVTSPARALSVRSSCSLSVKVFIRDSRCSRQTTIRLLVARRLSGWGEA